MFENLQSAFQWNAAYLYLMNFLVLHGQNEVYLYVHHNPSDSFQAGPFSRPIRNVFFYSLHMAEDPFLMNEEDVFSLNHLGQLELSVPYGELSLWYYWLFGYQYGQ